MTRVNFLRGYKRCACCKNTLPLVSFTRTKGKPYSYCRPCAKIKASGIKSKQHPRKRQIALLKGRYGLTIEDYDWMLALQGERCAICRSASGDSTGRRFHIDHCHKTNRVRGLLCSACNTALGMFCEQPSILRAAADYLETADTGLVANGSFAPRGICKAPPSLAA